MSGWRVVRHEVCRLASKVTHRSGLLGANWGKWRKRDPPGPRPPLALAPGRIKSPKEGPLRTGRRTRPTGTMALPWQLAGPRFERVASLAARPASGPRVTLNSNVRRRLIEASAFGTETTPETTSPTSPETPLPQQLRKGRFPKSWRRWRDLNSREVLSSTRLAGGRHKPG